MVAELIDELTTARASRVFLIDPTSTRVKALWRRGSERVMNGSSVRATVACARGVVGGRAVSP